MTRDQMLGWLVFAASIIGIIVYFCLMFVPPLNQWALLVMEITMFIGVGAVLAVLAWIGYTLATTPPPEPLPELEEELEEKEGGEV